MILKYLKEITIGSLIAISVSMCASMERTERIDVIPQEETTETARERVITIHDEKIIGDTPESIPVTYTITAYCECELCCGKWAKDRPNGVVVGAMGKPLKENYSVASPLPLGTKVIIDGLGTYEVQDRTADWIVERYDGKIIDIYVKRHEDIKKIGKQVRSVIILK